MATFWIAFVLCIIIGIVAEDDFRGGLWGAFIGLFVGFLAVFVVSGAMADTELSFNMVKSQEIVALKDSGNAAGSFFSR